MRTDRATAAPGTRGWRAELALAYERRDARTVLAARRHDGPLVVQKPLYPEGDAVCHTILVHPPAGVAGGDDLRVDAQLGDGARALFTTPGAGKWYRSAGPWASQRVALVAGGGATLEWLPQETIVFDGARAAIGLEADLAADALFIGWDIVCLGRTGSGERYERGTLRLDTTIRRDGAPIWIERATIEGGGAILRSPVGLGGRPVFGTMLACTPAIDAGLVAACRDVAAVDGETAVTLVPGVLAARYLGDSTAAARAAFAAIWRVLRPALAGRDAHAPRIWNT